MYRDFLTSISPGRPPEMRLERAIEDQQLMDQIMVTAREAGVARRRKIPVMQTLRLRSRDCRFRRRRRHARACAGPDGATHPLIERGGEVRSEPQNWSPGAVWKDLRYRTTERWVGADGVEFQPYTHYNVGGNTKYWGSVLYRLRREDFGETKHRDGLSPAWPISYEELAPWYDAAERLYHVHGESSADPPNHPAGRIRIRRCRMLTRWNRWSPGSSARACIPRRCRWDSSIQGRPTGVSSATRATRSRVASIARAILTVLLRPARRGGRG